MSPCWYLLLRFMYDMTFMCKWNKWLIICTTFGLWVNVVYMYRYVYLFSDSKPWARTISRHYWPFPMQVGLIRRREEKPRAMPRLLLLPWPRPRPTVELESYWRDACPRLQGLRNEEGEGLGWSLPIRRVGQNMLVGEMLPMLKKS